MTLIEKLRTIHLRRFLREKLYDNEKLRENQFLNESIFSTVSFNADVTQFETFLIFQLSQYYYDYLINGREGHYLSLYESDIVVEPIDS